MIAPRRFCRLLPLALLLVTPALAEVLFAPTSLRALPPVRRLLDAVDVRLMLPQGYAAAPELDADAELAQRRGVQEVRVYRKASGERIELGLVTTPSGTFDIAVYSPGSLAAIRTPLTSLVSSLNRAQASAAATPDRGYEMLRLGHIEADRAVALLKALGYYTIEFNPKSQGGDQIFDVVRGQTAKLPWVIKVTNASKTSLLETEGGSRTTTTRTTSTGSKGSIQGAPQLGGSHLHAATSGSPEERLLLVYDRNKPEDLETLVNLLQTHIDVAAQQIVIEALVIEINTTSLRDLGVDLSASQDDASASFDRSSGRSLATFTFSREAFTDFSRFSATLEALTEKGDAEVLSSPSVLVLNDRQARIQVGRQIPFTRTTTVSTTTTNQIKGIEYFPVGIVLNLRPRIDRERSEVTMQIETIISSIATESEDALGSVELAPIVDNRLVETYVRVADGTPFIIGGLLSTDEQEFRIGVPLLTALPLVGRLFSRERVEYDRREVIVVLTPHIVPEDARSFSYLIPKDSDIFDRFDYTLFRNAYRVRDDEVWDLKFIQESPVLRGIVDRIRGHAEGDVTIRRKEPFASFLAGEIPGEDILVRRMLKDIIEKLEFGDEVDMEKVFFFETAADHNLVDRSLGDALGLSLGDPGRAVLLSYDASDEPQTGSYFTYPFASVSDTTVPEDETERVLQLRQLNPVDADGRPLRWTIRLADRDDVTHLGNVLILKRLLDLNNKLPLTLEAFQPGVQILFPSREDMASRYHLIDRDVAQLFYETSSSQYYPAFERVFNRKVSEVHSILGGGGGR